MFDDVCDPLDVKARATITCITPSIDATSISYGAVESVPNSREPA